MINIIRKKRERQKIGRTGNRRRTKTAAETSKSYKAAAIPCLSLLRHEGSVHKMDTNRCALHESLVPQQLPSVDGLQLISSIAQCSQSFCFPRASIFFAKTLNKKIISSNLSNFKEDYKGEK